MAVFNRCLRSLEFLSRDISRSKGGMCLSLAQEEALGGLLLERLDTWHLPFPGDAAPCRSTVGGGDTPSHILLPLCTAGWVEIFRLVLQSRLLQHKLVFFPLTGSFG